MQRLPLKNLRKVLERYVQEISSKYPYWNRTSGAHHFFVSCHESALKVTQGVLVERLIRIVCHPNRRNGYDIEKDLVLPLVPQLFEHEAAGNDTRDRTKLLSLRVNDVPKETAFLRGSEA